MPTTSTACNSLLFLLRSFTVLMKQTRQAVCVIKQSIFCLSISMVGSERDRMFEAQISKDDEVKAMLPSVTQI